MDRRGSVTCTVDQFVAVLTQGLCVGNIELELRSSSICNQVPTKQGCDESCYPDNLLAIIVLTILEQNTKY